MNRLTGRLIRASYKLAPFLVLILLVGAACKSKKGAQKTAVAEKKSDAPKEASSAFFRRLAESNFDFKTLAFKGKARYHSAKDDQSFNYKLHIEKDKRIWASFSLLGIEGARMLVTRDSIKVIDRINRQYRLADFGYLSKEAKIPIDFNTLQKILLAELPINASDCKIAEQTPEKIMLTYKKGDRTLECDMDALILKILAMRGEDVKTGQKTTLDYTRFQDVEGTKLPFYIDFKAQDARVQLEHKQALLNAQDVTFSFSIPGDYELITE